MNNEIRPANLIVGETALNVPAFFPSISTVKTSLKPLDYTRILSSIGTENNKFLISAYDIFHASNSDKDELKCLISRLGQAGSIVLMDSGNYESYWKECKSWSRAEFHSVLRDVDVALAFCFDEQRPPENIHDHVELICRGYAMDQDATPDCTIIPIIHGHKEILPKLCATVAKKTGASIIAVPERRMGEGIFERARTLKLIRGALNETGRYIGLHLLGTGNPISISLYTIYGADSFDGLEWCQTVVDHNSGVLFHLSQADFFSNQTEWEDAGLPFRIWVLAHNLDFYTDWMFRLRTSVIEGQGIEFCQKNFPRTIYTKCAENMEW